MKHLNTFIIITFSILSAYGLYFSIDHIFKTDNLILNILYIFIILASCLWLFLVVKWRAKIENYYREN